MKPTIKYIRKTERVVIDEETEQIPIEAGMKVHGRTGTNTGRIVKVSTNGAGYTKWGILWTSGDMKDRVTVWKGQGWWNLWTLDD